MREKIRKATYNGKLHIGNIIIPCAVLEDGTRILSETGVAKSFGSRTGGSLRAKRKAREEGRAPMPVFLASDRLKPFIKKKLDKELSNPIFYKRDNKTYAGFPARILPQICDVWLEAKKAGALREQQKGRAHNAELLMRGLAHVGIIALVDEATGYQEIRDKQALQKILDKYLLTHYAKWAKRFPDEFYHEMFKLKGWQWEGMKVQKPSVIGRYTNDLVYERLAPKVLEELQKRNPTNDRGRRKTKHHQWSTEDIGIPALSQHIYTLIAFMRAAANWNQFCRNVDRAFPKFGNTIPLPFDDD